MRSKENKFVEFGHKAHILQVGGLNFIEHISPQVFNESTRLEGSIAYYERHFGTCKQVHPDISIKNYQIPPDTFLISSLSQGSLIINVLYNCLFPCFPFMI